MLAKFLIIFGLGMTFAGFSFLLEARTKGKFSGLHVVTKPSWNQTGWVLIVAGYVYQIFGVSFS